jgi:hypothetical protein
LCESLFSSSVAFLIMSVASQKCPPLNADISRGKGKNHLDQARRGLGKLQFHHIVLCQEILDLNRPVCWSIIVKEKLNAGSPYFREIPSDRIPKATKDVNVHFFNNSSKSCKLYKRIGVKYTSELREIFEATTYSTCYIFLKFRS